ncbi:MAG: hypothetical protein J0M34_01055 [Alphaproteobacteria bacterium]|nr:hypothetical protein [Alphaproteobacteria bacterium]
MFGFDSQWRDSRPSERSIGLVRIGLFIAVGWVNLIVHDAMLNGNIVEFARLRAEGNYTPFGLLMLFGDTPPAATFWLVVQAISWVSTFMAIIGLATRPAMILSTLSVLFLVLLDASRFIAWSHPYNVIFLCAIPFMFANAGKSLSLDKWLASRKPNYYFAPKNTPVLWSVLAVQYSAALFYFGAFWAKLVVTNGGWDYVFSDSMRHILAITWYGYVEMSVPAHVVALGSIPWLWQLIAAIHLLMQAIVLSVIFSVHRPNARLFEGVVFALSCIGLYALMSVSDPWWLLLIISFIDWDYYLPKLRQWALIKLDATSHQTSHAPIPQQAAARPRILMAWLAAFYGVYAAGFLSQKADELGIYPFSDMNMYAAIYALKPYDQHLPYVDIMRGNITIELPSKEWSMNMENGRWIRTDQMSPMIRQQMLPRISRKTTREDPVLISKDGATLRFLNIPDSYPLLARETDLEKLEYSMKEFLNWLSPLPQLPKESMLVLRQQTVAFSAYPQPLGEKSIFHSGIRAVYEIGSGRFVGASPTFDVAMRRIYLNGVGITDVGPVEVSAGVLEVPSPLPYVTAKGHWVDGNTFEIDKDFYKSFEGKLVNILIHAKTDLGPQVIDGPLVRW